MGALQRFRRDTVRADRALALCLFVLAQFELWGLGTIPGPRWLGLLATATGTLPVAARRAHPLVAVALVSWTFVIVIAVSRPPSSVALMIAWICTLYAVAVWTETIGFTVGCGLMAAAMTAASVDLHAVVGGVAIWAGIPVAAMVITRRIVREREARADAQAARADALEREQELRAREAAALERATIARELHDVVAHKVSVMVVQAGAERSVLEPSETSTEETLRTIEAAGREALVELRRLLGVLRDGEQGQSLSPQPTLDDIDALVTQVRDAGLDVELRIEGEPRRLAPGVELSAFRIVQESLTNVFKHAQGARTSVALRFGTGELEIEIRDDGGAAGQPGPGTGHGLLGIREHVALHGGRVDAGPDGGGYAVHAWLPASG